MKKIFKGTILASILIGVFLGCDTPRGENEYIDYGSYPITEEAASTIPYALGESIPFVHTSGYEFFFVVTEEETTWEKTYLEEYDTIGLNLTGASFTPSTGLDLSPAPHWVGFVEYEKKRVVLTSSYPQFEVELETHSCTIFAEDQSVSMRVNHTYRGSMWYDSLGEMSSALNEGYLPEYALNSDTALGVVQNTFEGWSGDIPSSMRVSYSRNIGLVQLEVGNDDTYTCNK